MNKHEKELKKPDAFLTKGRAVLLVLQKNIQAVLVTLAILGLVAGGLALMSYETEKKELGLQEDYYRIEKNYLKKLEELEKANAPEAATLDKKEKKPEVTPENKIAKLNDEISQFKSLVEKAPESKAGAMAALTAANLYFENKNWDEGYKILELSYQKQNKNTLIKGLLAHALGVAQANMGKCDVAVKTWEALIKDNAYSFMVDELKLKTAVCQQQLGQYAEAEKLFTDIKAKTDSPQSKIAEKYLRFLKNKKQGS